MPVLIFPHEDTSGLPTPEWAQQLATLPYESEVDHAACLGAYGQLWRHSRFFRFAMDGEDGDLEYTSDSQGGYTLHLGTGTGSDLDSSSEDGE